MRKRQFGPGEVMYRVMTGLGVVLASASSVLATNNGAVPGAISESELRRDVDYLASDELRGRDTGEAGIHAAEEYIAEAFRAAGLSPIPDRDDYFIDFTLYRQGYVLEATELEVWGKQGFQRGVPGLDFRPFPFSETGEVEAEVVFAGYGITAPEYAYDDYADLDVEGRIVLVLRHEPGENDSTSLFDGERDSDHALFTRKAENARTHGAVAMILVTDPLNHPPGDDLRLGDALRLQPPEVVKGQGDGEDEESELPFLAIHVSREIAETMVGWSGHVLLDLQMGLDAGSLRPAYVQLPGVRARLRVTEDDAPIPVAARNVAGFLEGRDPDLRQEIIVIGGHHDHVGAFDGPGDTIFNGADDNASGTAGVMALARAFGAEDERPRRSLLFMTFSGEERGLLGSRAAVRQDLIPVDRVVFMVNLDMIGRNPDKPVELTGDGFARGLREVVEAANADVSAEIDFGGPRYMGNTDHDSFFDRDIPYLTFFTGLHDDYTQVGDHADKLAYDRMADLVRLGYGVVSELADMDRVPHFIHRITWLGIEMEVLENGDGPRATVTRVESDSRGAEAGFQTGDVVVAIGNRGIGAPREVGQRFREVEPGHRVEMSLQRGGDTVSVEVERARTGYLGIWPGPVSEDDRAALGLSDNEGVRARQVVSGGPSAEAGIQAGDILVAIGGRPVSLGSLRSRLSQIGAGETVDAAIIRDGERLTLALILGERPDSN